MSFVEVTEVTYLYRYRVDDVGMCRYLWVDDSPSLVHEGKIQQAGYRRFGQELSKRNHRNIINDKSRLGNGQSKSTLFTNNAMLSRTLSLL